MNIKWLMGAVCGGVVIAFPQSLGAQQIAYNWQRPASGAVAWKFFDPKYPTNEDPAQHLGIDIDVAADSPVTSPVDGVVVINKTRGFSPDVAFLVLKENALGTFHVLGHITSELKGGTQVRRGQPVGTAMRWVLSSGKENTHVHWGANRIAIKAQAENGWGWGRAPRTATITDATARGWIDVQLWLSGGAAAPVTVAASSAYDQTLTVKGGTFQLPPKTKLVEEGKCNQTQVAVVQGVQPEARYCLAQAQFKGRTLLVFQNWQRDEVNPGIFRIIHLGAGATDLGSVSADTGIQFATVDDKFPEIFSVSFKSWSKDPNDPPYLRYRVIETGIPKLVLIPNALSAREKNPIRSDLSSVTNPVLRLLRRPKSMASVGAQSSPNSGTYGNRPKPSTSPTAPTAERGADNCAGAAWSGVVTSIPDLFECDTPRAIDSLSRGRQAIIEVESVRFQGGKYIISFSDRASRTKRSINEMNNRNFSWDNWLDATQSKFYTVTCLFGAGRGAALKVGASIQATVTLDSYSGTAIVMNCS